MKRDVQVAWVTAQRRWQEKTCICLMDSVIITVILFKKNLLFYTGLKSKILYNFGN